MNIRKSFETFMGQQTSIKNQLHRDIDKLKRELKKTHDAFNERTVEITREIKLLKELLLLIEKIKQLESDNQYLIKLF